MNFVRGQDPKEAMGIGRESILKEIGGLIIDKENNDSKFSPETNVVFLLSKGKYKVLINRFGNVGEEVEEKDFITLLLKIQEQFRKWDPMNPFFIHAQKVAARTIGLDLVAVKPMSAPLGVLYYYDRKKANKITMLGRKILNKIRRKTI